MAEFIEHELTCNEHMKIFGNESHFYKCRPDHPEFHDCHPDMTWNEVNVSTYHHTECSITACPGVHTLPNT